MAHRIEETGLENIPQDIMYDSEGNMTASWLHWFSNLIDSVPFFRAKAVTLDPGSIGANTTATETVTFNGVTTNDLVAVNKPSHTTGLSVSAFVSAADTVTLVFMNATGGAIDPGSEDYLLFTVRM